jgi:hypothetical protein
MPRRFNYTGRKKIRRPDAEIRLQGAGADLRFDAKLSLEGYGLDPHARVAVEAYRSRTASYRRFEFGHVNAPLVPADRSLADFQEPDGILFRVKVTLDQDGLGKLLAEADGINPRRPDETDDTAKPLIDVQCADLDGEAWRLDFPGAGAPVLLIDRRIPAGTFFAKDPVFRVLVVPGILREILTRLFLIDPELIQEDDPEHWTSRWLQFARAHVGRDVPDPEEDEEEVRQEWIDDAVREFARRGKLIDCLLAPAE